MTQDEAPRQDARDLQAKLYREIGISAVAAALRFTTQPDPAPRAEARPEARLDEAAKPDAAADRRAAARAAGSARPH